MSETQRVARNVIWNWASTATHMVAGFVIFPVLIQRLGDSDCGLWIIIVSLTGYFDLLDLGLRGSLGRNIAFFRAKNDGDGVNSVFNTGLVLLGIGSVFVLAASALIQLFFFDLFDVRGAAWPDVRMAVWLIGLNLALIFPLNVLESTLWGHERFDMISWVEIPCVVIRTALTFALVTVDAGSANLVTLALIILATTVLRGAGQAACVLGIERGLRLAARHVNLATARHLFDFGIWCLLLSVANVISQQLGPLLIGNRFSTTLVTPYSAGARLVGYVKTILMTSTGVLTPLATAWHATEEHAKQRWLFVNGGKVCLTLGLFFLGGFWLLGESFLQLWTHLESAPLALAWTVLMILMLGELLPLSQWVTYSTVLGMNRHRLWAVMSMLEIGLIVALTTVLLALNYDIVSVAVAVAVPGALCRGFVQMVSACRLLEVRLSDYVRWSMLPPILAAVPAMLVLALLTDWHTPETWVELFGFGAAYSLVFITSAALLLVGRGNLKAIARTLRRARSVEPEDAASICEHTPLPSPTDEPAALR